MKRRILVIGKNDRAILLDPADKLDVFNDRCSNEKSTVTASSIRAGDIVVGFGRVYGIQTINLS
jgi:hypothetical protein